MDDPRKAGSAWWELPPGLRLIHNPAHCAAVLAELVRGYETARKAPMHFVLLFPGYILSVVPPYRDVAPKKSTTSFAGWALNNKELVLSLQSRCVTLRPAIVAGVQFGLSTNAISLKGGRLTTEASPYIRKVESYAKEIRVRPYIVGRWFGNAGSVETICRLLGVTL